tara:strand:+ start:1188 stop:1751 length:564 start_codon:yes stop_codon:yes gene_type:complete
MKQLSLNIIDNSVTKTVASSSFDYKIEIIKKIGKLDINQIIYISKDLAKKYGNHLLISEKNIHKYFNQDTLPFIARYKGEIIGYIIGVPLEYFNQESWCRYDVNLNKNNTIYTYAFIIQKKFRKKGGFAKTLKMIYLNWAKKRGYKYVSGHVIQGLSKKFSKDTEIIKIFPNWYGLNTPYEYYRRLL